MESITNLEQKSLIVGGMPRTLSAVTIAEDAGRTVDLVNGTVLGLDVSANKWIPLEDLSATDGTTLNIGVYVGPTVPHATIAAGDVVVDAVILGGDVLVREDMVVVEGSNTLDTAYGAGALATTIRMQLSRNGISVQSTKTSTNFA